MRIFVVALLLLGIASAFTVEPDYFGVQDTGSESLPTMDVKITIDCDTKDITVKASSDDAPLEGASTVLFYTDYAYQALPGGGKTDTDGNITMKVPGTIDFLTALFILRADKQGYQSREIEFAYEKCFEPPPAPDPEPEENETEKNETVEEPAPAENDTPPVNVTPPANATPPNVTVNETADLTENETGVEEQEPSACPIGALLLALLFIRVRA